MKMISVREFRNGVSALTRKGRMAIVTNHGRVVGCYLPLAAAADVPLDFKREFVSVLGRQIASRLPIRAEQDILDDFRKFKKTRRR